MPTTGPGRDGEPHRDESTAHGRRGRLLVSGTVLGGLAVVLAVLLGVSQCGQEVQENGSADRPAPVVQEVVPAGGPGRA
ncbi:hypothetical protein SAMN06893096_109134 [Geodermatophilus pulveris]|uniref:Uncharacterized protein n=1 Tax=Geodermatophilus pulveris TaxID=1564159 RepID=A0A239I3E0_9ACTN|nr:hypothetical protein [Geodermatophilus pulveris]SNS86864.1 hypothetical protein SAMN06893096_109134 [Geodermatophilus pulveris]